MSKRIKVRKLIYEMDLVILTEPNVGLDNNINVEMVNRPGLELTGYSDQAEIDRIVVIGEKETVYLETFSEEEIDRKIEQLFKVMPPAIILSNNVNSEKVKEIFVKYGNKYTVPVFLSGLKTTPLMSTLYSVLHRELSQRLSVHGVLVDIHGMGTLIMGKSGIGKSETALELVKRGHLLVSDDLVEVYQVTVGYLVGEAPSILRRYLEIRGIGIVDVVSMFGTGAYRRNKKISLIVELEKWDDKKQYDRLGLDNVTTKMFDTEVPKITIPVVTGRNIASLVESAAMNMKLKLMGYSAALNFTQSVANKAMGKGKDEDDE